MGWLRPSCWRRRGCASRSLRPNPSRAALRALCRSRCRDFLHDFGSAVHPFAAVRRFSSRFRLADYGLEWVHGEAPLGASARRWHGRGAGARPRTMRRSELGRWQGVAAPHATRSSTIGMHLRRMPGPDPSRSASPVPDGAFGLAACSPRRMLAEPLQRRARRALFAGLAGHSFLSFDQPLSSAVGLDAGRAAHAVGWPIPRGGAGAITRGAHCAPEALGGTFTPRRRIDAAGIARVGGKHTLTFSTPRRAHCLSMAGDRLADYRRTASDSSPPRAHSKSTTLFPSRFRGGRPMPSRHHGASGRHLRGNRRSRKSSGPRPCIRAALCSGRPAHAL